MSYVADRVFESTTSTGTGALSLAGAETGYRGFVAALQEDTDEATGPWTDVPYLIYSLSGSDIDEWEYGFGTITDGTPDTLTRVLVHYSSAGAATAEAFSAGTKYVKLVAISANPTGFAISTNPPFWWKF